MNELRLKISGDSGKSPAIKVDGKAVRFKKNEFGSSEAVIQTENEYVELSVYKYLEIKSRFWLLFYILFFIISICGLLDHWGKNDCTVIEYKIRIHMQEKTQIRLSMNNSLENKVDIDTECEYEELENTCYVDPVAKRRFRILFIIKIISWVALAALSVYLIVNSIN